MIPPFFLMLLRVPLERKPVHPYFISRLTASISLSSRAASAALISRFLRRRSLRKRWRLRCSTSCSVSPARTSSPSSSSESSSDANGSLSPSFCFFCLPSSLYTSSSSSGSGTGVAVVAAASDCSASSSLAADSRRRTYPSTSSMRRRLICAPSTLARSTTTFISSCISRGRTTPSTSTSTTHSRSLVCTSVRVKEAYSDMRPVSRLETEKTGVVIMGGRTIYSGASNICSTSRPVRKVKHRSSRSASLRWSRLRRSPTMLFHARAKCCHRMSSASGRKSTGSAPATDEAPSLCADISVGSSMTKSSYLPPNLPPV
mmetsp:Transcript_24276/g.60311  ORF Transcript_24276/g.60311 Transcript_24276/m.60311 type:complete len:316 (+) Transcript_24276:3616-4563(+)